MSVYICTDYYCENRNSFGYCKLTACPKKQITYTDHTCYTLSRNSNRCDVCGAILSEHMRGDV